MILKFKYTLLALLGFTALRGQVNLVPNGSFEIYSECPDNEGQINNAINWYDVWAAGGADYFNACSINSQSTQPNNIWGFQYPKSGNAYAGLGIFAVNTISQENIIIKLEEELLENNNYCIEFYISLSDNSSYYTNKLGIYFSSDSIDSNTNDFTFFEPQFINTASLFDTIGWVKISGQYTAVGGEKFITIGNFNTLSYLDTVFIGYTPDISYELCYYYIDDVSVYCCDSSVCQPFVGNSATIYPNPANNYTSINYNIATSVTNSSLEVFDNIGRIVYSAELNSASGNLDVPTYSLSAGIYYVRIRKDKSIFWTGKLAVQ
ncbi:MAG: T9SS type A sorting domain-containing protein [Sphingobacteriales bacterium JAD_PAG50586_3]|nr:MAG: T9SS type A sorting domain-containing protein [Sphingobacteriales bacterium JAD_PAG50586_3]